MENLNAEQVKKALECCVTDSCISCPYDDVGVYSQCVPTLLENALALINSQEQDKEKLGLLISEIEKEKQKLFGENKRLTEENSEVKANWQKLKESNESDCEEYRAEFKKLTEENERLRGILLQFTDIVHKWGNKHGYDTSEISLVPVIYEANTIKSQIKADTVRKMQERLKAKMNDLSRKDGIFDTYYLVSKSFIDKIAKEMLGDE